MKINFIVLQIVKILDKYKINNPNKYLWIVFGITVLALVPDLVKGLGYSLPDIPILNMLITVVSMLAASFANVKTNRTLIEAGEKDPKHYTVKEPE